jgi:hypothetical protein
MQRESKGMKEEAGGTTVQTTYLCLASLCSLPPDGIPSDLLGQHHGEPLEIVQRPSLLDGSPLLCPGRLVPLLYDLLLLHELFHDAGTGSAWEVGEAERGQGEVLVGEGLAWHAGSGTVNNGAVVVDDFGNNSDLASRRTRFEEDNPTNLDETGESGIAHGVVLKLLDLEAEGGGGGVDFRLLRRDQQVNTEPSYRSRPGPRLLLHPLSCLSWLYDVGGDDDDEQRTTLLDSTRL